MKSTIFLDPVQILYNGTESVKLDAVLIDEGKVRAFGNEARIIAQKENIQGRSANEQLIAPCLVDPHSILIDPLNGKNETLKSLKQKAANAGYGQIGLLPKGSTWRDQPELIQGFNTTKSDISIHLWGGFSIKGQGKELSPHANLIKNGAIGIAEYDSIPPIEILRKGLLTNELGKSPLLLAPRDVNIQGSGMVREGVETLRSGWFPDPIESETLPLSQLLELQKQHTDVSMRLMNISTAAAVSMLSNCLEKPMASVSWWHLVSDNSSLNPTDIGWRVVPSLGSHNDRQSLINALYNKTLNAIAVNSLALDDSDIKGAPEKRLTGLTGYHLVLPCLWNELINKSGWTIEKLWDSLSFGPSRMLNSKEESLSIGSRRWLIFDPNKKWVQSNCKGISESSANEPFNGKEITGQIIHCGLIA
tara:strand:+ start:14327 stop:15583 length:1257 start_codon:yes stop_codon:yes gene_type:complete